MLWGTASSGASHAGELSMPVSHGWIFTTSPLPFGSRARYHQRWWASRHGNKRATSARESARAASPTGSAQARADKDWAAADAIRDQLKNAGIVVDDTSGGSTWSLDAGKDS